MPYKFAAENKDYADFASGRAFYNAPGHPVLPVRLVSELFQRCTAVRQQQGLTAPVTIYDPCCGSAYHLSTLAYLHWAEIESIIASDIDTAVLPTAQRNLNLLTQAGLQNRIAEIARMQQEFGKPSHDDAADSARKLAQRLQENLQDHAVKTAVFTADAANAAAIERGIAGQAIDIVIADVPYGQRSSWHTSDESLAGEMSLVEPMLAALRPVLSEETVVAIIANKTQKFAHENYRRLGRFQIGKRRVTLLQMLGE